MYCQFYGLKERPFNVTSDPAFFFMSKQHKEALSHLLYGVTQRKGIIAVTGEIGTGKTTLCRFFLSQLKKNVKTAFILNPYFSEHQLLEAITNDFGLKINNKSKLAFVWGLNEFLLNESKNGNNVMIIIDEAQNLRPQALEQIRLLSNLETEKDKLLQIVLMGQPELNRKLDLYELRQLKQRIMVRCHIAPLEQNELKEYVNHRLNVAGSNANVTFTDDALKIISGFSSGVPRLVNIICDRALLAGFVAEAKTIDPDIINKCINELNAYKENIKQ
jgi:general secretion pathway protein A